MCFPSQLMMRQLVKHHPGEVCPSERCLLFNSPKILPELFSCLGPQIPKSGDTNLLYFMEYLNFSFSHLPPPSQFRNFSCLLLSWLFLVLSFKLMPAEDVFPLTWQAREGRSHASLICPKKGFVPRLTSLL